MEHLPIFGIHAVAAKLNILAHSAGELWVLSSRTTDRLIAPLIERARNLGLNIRKVTRNDLNEVCKNGRHQGVALFITLPVELMGSTRRLLDEIDLDNMLENAQYPDNLLLLVLDQVTDPHNLGACIRTAEITRVDAIIIPKDRSAKVTPVVEKVASGAADKVPLIAVTNLARTLERLKKYGIWTIGLAGEARDSIYQMDFRSSVALVVGSEGSGLRRLTRVQCDYLAYIPMLGTVSSLNVSVAAGVGLYEVVRQRFYS